MDFLITSLLLEGKRLGYQRFNLGMAPLASVGEQQRGAHVRERLARLLFQRGEQWYNFQGVRFYKQKFNPDWVPRYMAYQAAAEWPVAAAYVSALIAGSWGSALRPARERRLDRHRRRPVRARSAVSARRSCSPAAACIANPSSRRRVFRSSGRSFCTVTRSASISPIPDSRPACVHCSSMRLAIAGGRGRISTSIGISSRGGIRWRVSMPTIM